MTITNSLLTGNSGAYGGGIYVYAGSLTLAGSTLHGNTASVNGGGISIGGSTLTVLNSTLTGNQADADGANAGGAIESFADTTMAIINSVVAENTSGTAMAADDIVGTIATATNSVFGTDVTITTATNVQESVTDPGLGLLQDNGGTVLTRVPLASSPLIDAGDTNNAPAGDAANGLPRVIGAAVDIGAAEAIPPALVVSTADDEDDGNYSAGDLSLREAVKLANQDSDANTSPSIPRSWATPSRSAARRVSANWSSRRM